MLTVFFDWEGVAHHEYTPPGQTINKKYYLNVLHHLRLWAAGDWQLHHNNVPTHASCLVQRFLGKHQSTQVTQVHNSPDWEPWEFCLLQNKITFERERDFRPLIRHRKTMRQLMTIPKKDFAVF